MAMLETDGDGARRLKLDVATVYGGQPQLIAQGLPETHSPDFPLNLLERGFCVDIANGNATVPVDKNRILNSIIGADASTLDNDPPVQHVKYDEVTSAVCACVAFICHALDAKTMSCQ